MKTIVNRVLMVETDRKTGEYITSHIINIPINQQSATRHQLQQIEEWLIHLFPYSDTNINYAQNEVKRVTEDDILLYSVVSFEVEIDVK